MSAAVKMNDFGKVVMDTWWHTCFGFNFNTGDLSVVINGDVIYDGYSEYVTKVSSHNILQEVE